MSCDSKTLVLCGYPRAFACYSTVDGMFRIYADRDRSATLSTPQPTESLAWASAYKKVLDDYELSIKGYCRGVLGNSGDRVAESIGMNTAPRT